MPRGRSDLVPGVCGNPKGRPRGSKNKYPKKFEAAMIKAAYELAGEGEVVKLAKKNWRMRVEVWRLAGQFIMKRIPQQTDLGIAGTGKRSIKLEISYSGNGDQVQGEPDTKQISSK